MGWCTNPSEAGHSLGVEPEPVQPSSWLQPSSWCVVARTCAILAKMVAARRARVVCALLSCCRWRLGIGGGVLVLPIPSTDPNWCCQYQDAVCAITSRARCERHPERVSRRSKRPRRSRRGTRLPPIQAPCRRPEQGLETAQERAREKGGWDGRKGGRRGEGEAWST